MSLQFTELRTHKFDEVFPAAFTTRLVDTGDHVIAHLAACPPKSYDLAVAATQPI